MNGIQFKIDTEDIDSLVAASFAFDQIGRQSNYLQNLISASYAQTNEEFNREVVAFASATGALGHMFEWGTQGINRGKSSTRPNPMSEQARLWVNVFDPGRAISKLEFIYKPSVATVPKPTTKKTGIPSEVLKKLKTHVFEHKAFVLETGVAVTIKPKPENVRRLLFVPNLWKGEKGYQMYSKSTNPNVSEDTKGTFTIYWMNFWEGRGEAMIQEQVDAYFAEDIRKVIAKIEASPRKVPKIVKPGTNKSVIDRKARTIRKYMESQALKRLRNGQ